MNDYVNSTLPYIHTYVHTCMYIRKLTTTNNNDRKMTEKIKTKIINRDRDRKSLNDKQRQTLFKQQ